MTCNSSALSLKGNRTAASCKTHAEHVLVHGRISYTDAVEPRHEGSRAMFSCDTGYQLSGAAYMMCREGQWSGAMPTCVDIDECDGIDCGGSSNCTNDIGKYICECAEGWHGGGVNKTCEKGDCKCTGNQGYSKSPNMLVDGKIKLAYDYGAAYGDYCKAWDDVEEEKNAFGDEAKSLREPWYANRLTVCYIVNSMIQTVQELFAGQTLTVLPCDRCYVPCDPSSCSVKIPRYETAYLWRAGVENFKLCYSFENCGGVDYFTDGVAVKCTRRGGYFVDWKCTCDIPSLAGTCKGDTTSDTITPLASYNNSTNNGESEGQG